MQIIAKIHPRRPHSFGTGFVHSAHLIRDVSPPPPKKKTNGVANRFPKLGSEQQPAV